MPFIPWSLQSYKGSISNLAYFLVPSSIVAHVQCVLRTLRIKVQLFLFLFLSLHYTLNSVDSKNIITLSHLFYFYFSFSFSLLHIYHRHISPPHNSQSPVQQTLATVFICSAFWWFYCRFDFVEELWRG